jgi:hypothetical protein
MSSEDEYQMDAQQLNWVSEESEHESGNSEANSEQELSEPKEIFGKSMNPCRFRQTRIIMDDQKWGTREKRPILLRYNKW